MAPMGVVKRIGIGQSERGRARVRASALLVLAATAWALVASAPALAASRPSNTAAPSIAGSAVTGDTLTAAAGSWTGTGATTSYQWSRCLLGGGPCTQISGATKSSYVPSASDQGFAVDVVVTETNSGGSASASSARTAAVPVPPSNINVTIAGRATVGGQLTAFAHWAGSGLTYSYQWLDCTSGTQTCAPISGATASTYTVAASDASHTIEVTVKASNSGGSASATSSQTWPIVTPVAHAGNPVNAGKPAVSGTAAEGDALTTTVGGWSGTPSSYAYQWYDCNASGASCSSVADAGNAQTYVPTSNDVGHTLEVAVSATNQSGSTRVSSGATAVVTAAGSTPAGLTIKGDQLVDDAGAVVDPHGVDRAGTEYACWQFDAISDGPIDAPSVAAMSTWNINFVRIQLNEDCWLGINGVPANVSGANYVNAIRSFVNTLHQYGMYAYLSLMSGHPGAAPPSNTEPAAPDEDHSVLFWEQLASTFKSDPNVIIAPQSETTVDWNCYMHGCSNEATSAGGPFDGLGACPNTSGCYYYQSAGMDQALQVIRGAGFNGPVAIPCINWANECGDYSYESDAGSWLTEVPGADPDHQVMAETHIYTGQVCAAAACFNATLLPILKAGYPVIAGETGSQSTGCTAAGGSNLLPWFAANGMGWLSYAWDVYGGSCTTLISSYEPPTPTTGGYGAYVQSFDRAQPG